jgi:hypothetical protein
MTNRPKGKQSAKKKAADRRADASLRRRRLVWWTHFGFKGQFFRFSLGTSDRSRAKRLAKKLIALAEAGKISAVAQTPDERKVRRSASLKRSHADPKVSAAATRAAKGRWKKASKEDREEHGDAIRAGQTPEIRRAMAEATTDLWKDSDYVKRVRRGQKRFWSDRTPSGRSHRRAQSKTLTAACKRPEVKASRFAGKLASVAALLRAARRKKNPGKRGPVPKPTESTWHRIGSKIHEKIPVTMRSDRHVITAARKAYSEETRGRVSLEMCASYHRRYMHWLKANPPVVSEVPSQ